MKFTDLIEIIWRNMWKRRARTIFTMLGVIIGCLAVFIISSITNGFEKYLTNEMESLMDTSIITIYPNWNGDTSKNNNDSKNKLDEKCVKELEGLGHFTEVTPKRYAHALLKIDKRESFGRILAKDVYEKNKENELIAGRFPKAKSKEILLPYEIAKEFLGYTWEDKLEDKSELENLVGKKIKIGGEYVGEDEKGNEIKSKQFSCKVVGILPEGDGMDAFNLQASSKLVEDIIKSNPLNDPNMVNEMLSTYEEIQVRVNDKNKLEEYEATLKNLGYQTNSFKEFEKQTKGMLLGVNLILGTLAGISLLVAALGITNTMDMAIYERNKEIGVIKVIGGSLNDVRKIFVGEACAIAFTGGVISIILGIFIDMGINTIAKTITTNMLGRAIEKIAIPSVGLIIGILIFCLVIGFLSGILPANKAAKTDVITAIR